MTPRLTLAESALLSALSPSRRRAASYYVGRVPGLGTVASVTGALGRLVAARLAERHEGRPSTYCRVGSGEQGRIDWGRVA